MCTKGHGLSLLLPLSTCLFNFFLEQISRPLAQKHVQPGLEVHFFVCQEQGSSVANTQKAKQGQDVTGACCALSTSLLCNKHLQRAHSNSAALAMLRAVLHLVSVVAHIGSLSTSSSKLLYLAPHGSWQRYLEGSSLGFVLGQSFPHGCNLLFTVRHCYLWHLHVHGVVLQVSQWGQAWPILTLPLALPPISERQTAHMKQQQQEQMLHVEAADIATKTAVGNLDLSKPL